ncbi:MAG: ATPase [Bacteroidales bacterium]|nr:ATPase [Bacteroidales bacterium]HOI33574.1 ATPase [Bacteroidales bacterium]
MSEIQIIVDSGGTKSDWMLRINGLWQAIVSLEGYNPWQSNEIILERIVQNLLVQHPESVDATRLIYYGSGCGNEKNKSLIRRILSEHFQKAAISVYSDLMAAAHALFGKDQGIACILGTGSNSGYYDGESILSSPPSLGFLLGDEGSGAWIGKTLAQLHFRKQMPVELSEKFASSYALNLQDFLNAVYHQNLTASFFARFVYFAIENRQHKWITEMLFDAFNSFVQFNIKTLDGYQLHSIGFVGSVAFQFQDIIRQVLAIEGLKATGFLKKPADALMAYHEKSL